MSSVQKRVVLPLSPCYPNANKQYEIERSDLLKLVTLPLFVDEADFEVYKGIFDYVVQFDKRGFRSLLPSGPTALLAFNSIESAKRFLQDDHSHARFFKSAYPSTESHVLRPFDKANPTRYTDLFTAISYHGSVYYVERSKLFKSSKQGSDTVISSADSSGSVCKNDMLAVSAKLKLLGLRDSSVRSATRTASYAGVPKGRFEEDEEVQWWIGRAC